ncbi:c-type cytochrome [Alloyangia pacifica]|uniref:c-type cytochrome n=1 Tax=Alloyangia pacifica TaxID=311180 RepID=UPI001CFE5965|nr:cytochrome c family protein [Alloyangia pacifica]
MYQGTLTAGLILALSAGMALAEGDAAKGEKVFRKCQACHMVGEDAENRVGPVLTGVVGREIAAVEDFDYSDALQELAAADGTWTPEELSAFLEKPRDFAKGTKMSFAGLRKEEERADVIAYLATFGDGGS